MSQIASRLHGTPPLSTVGWQNLLQQRAQTFIDRNWVRAESLVLGSPPVTHPCGQDEEALADLLHVLSGELASSHAENLILNSHQVRKRD